MLRLTLQRLAVKRRVAEQLEAVSLEDVLRRMQSSSLTNPARSLEAHFALAADGAEERAAATAAAAATTATAAAAPGAAEVLRDVLSDRLVLEVRRCNMQRHLSLDDGSLMLANCLRHRLAPAATQETFAFWQRCMNRAAYTADGGTATSAAAGELAQFQALVRVMEACLDAHEQRQRERAAAAAAATAVSSGSRDALGPAAAGDAIDLTLDHWAAMVDLVEKHWALFADHGTSTAGLLVQFLALGLREAGCATAAATVVHTADLAPGSDEAEESGSGGGFVSGLRFLSHLRTDRALLQERVLCLCDRAITSLCEVEAESDAVAHRTASSAAPAAAPWWHRPQDLVRLSQAMRMVDAYETQHGRGAPAGGGGSSARAPPLPVPGTAEGRGEETAGARRVNSARGLGGAAVVPRGDGTRGAAVRAASAAPSTTSSASSRWVPRMPPAWWPVPATGAAAAAAGGGVRVGRRLGFYVTHHALTHMTLAPVDVSRPTSARTGSRPATAGSTASAASAAAPLPLPTFAVTSALCTVSFADVAEVFDTVRTTAAATTAADAVMAFSWWVRDVIYHRHRQRSLHDVDDVAGLLRIAEVCLAHPDGTQTVLAEALKCMQRSCGFMWRVRGASAPAAAAAGAEAASPRSRTAARARNTAEECALALLWARACDVVSAAMPLLTVRAEAQRTLQALAHTAGESSASELAAGPAVAVARRHQRHGLLVLACLQLQSPGGGALSGPFTRVLRELVLSVPFQCDEADRGGLGAVVRALYIFTRPRAVVPAPPPAAEADEDAAWEPVVPHLVGVLHRLLSIAPEAGLSREGSGVTATTATDAEDAWQHGERLVALQQRLTASERELLRAALREVRLLAQHTGTEVLSATPLLDEGGGDVRGGSPAVSLSQTRRTRHTSTVPAAPPPRAAVRPPFAVRRSTASLASPAHRRSTPSWSARGSASVSRLTSGDAAAAAEHRRRTVDSANSVLLQAEMDTLIRQFRERRTPGCHT